MRLIQQATLPLFLSVPLLNGQEPAAPIEALDETVIIDDSGDSLPIGTTNEADALRTGTPLIDIPQSVTVIGKERLDDQGITSIGGIIDYTPGVTNSQGEGHRDSVVFRGVRSTADFFVDGLRDDVQYYRDLYNVEKIEILRGPSALFFGRGGTGGVLNRVLKKAQVGENFTEFQTSVDTFGSYGGRIDYNQAVGDKAAFRLNAHYDWLENHRDFYEGERFGINPTFTYEFSRDTTARFSYEYANHDRFIDRGIPSDASGDPIDRFQDDTFGDSVDNFNDLEAHTFRVDFEHRFSDQWRARGSAFYGTYDKVYSNYFPSDFDDATDRVEIDGYIDRTDRETFILSGDLLGEFELFGADHKVMIGGEYIRTTSDQNRFNSVFDSNGQDQQFFQASGFRMANGAVIGPGGALIDRANFTDLNDDTRADVDVYSFFLQDEIAITEKLDVVLGARFDSFDIKVRNAVNSKTRTNTDEEVSPRFGIIYKPVENVSIYGSYSESFLPRSGEQFANINGDRNRLDPDTFSNLEAGVKWDLHPDASLTVSAFRIDQESPQVDPTGQGFDIIQSRIEGFEAQFQGRITDQWSLFAGYSFLSGDSATTGLRLRELPKHTFSIWNQYQVTEKFGLGLGLVYQDESFTTNDPNGTAVRAELPSFVRVDAAAYYQINDCYRVQLNVENLFDTDYYPDSHTANNISVGAPLNARLALIGRF